jgi:hypothetical protein
MGIHNVRIKEGDEWKAAFITNKGLFEPTVMFFGLRNSPATFQAMMDDYFRDMINEGWITIYMDDILIHAKMKQDLEKRTKMSTPTIKGTQSLSKTRKNASSNVQKWNSVTPCHKPFAQNTCFAHV